MLNENLKKDIELVYFELVQNLDLNKEENIIQRTEKYLTHLKQRELDSHVLSSLSKIPDMIKSIQEASYSHNKKLLLASFEYLIDQWDIIPDTSIDGLNDDAYVIELANSKLDDLKQKQSNAKKIRLNPDSILDGLNYSVKHLLKLSKQRQLYDVKESRFIMKMHNYNRSNVPIPRKERSYFTILIERYLDEFGPSYKCNIPSCDDCYTINRYFNQTLK